MSETVSRPRVTTRADLSTDPYGWVWTCWGCGTSSPTFPGWSAAADTGTDHARRCSELRQAQRAWDREHIGSGMPLAEAMARHPAGKGLRPGDPPPSSPPRRVLHAETAGYVLVHRDRKPSTALDDRLFPTLDGATEALSEVAYTVGGVAETYRQLGYEVLALVPLEVFR